MKNCKVAGSMPAIPTRRTEDPGRDFGLPFAAPSLRTGALDDVPVASICPQPTPGGGRQSRATRDARKSPLVRLTYDPRCLGRRWSLWPKSTARSVPGVARVATANLPRPEAAPVPATAGAAGAATSLSASWADAARRLTARIDEALGLR